MMKPAIFTTAILCFCSAVHAQYLPALVKDINPGKGNSLPNQITPVGTAGNKTVFTATDTAHGTELWVTDGTTAGTQLLKDIYPGPIGSGPDGLYAINHKVYFNATDAFGHNELWVTDGTYAGTHIVKAIYPGGTCAARGFAGYNGKIFFQAADTNGTELWVTDGTATGTHLVKDINPGNLGSYPYTLTVYNGLLYFTADDGVHGGEPWVTDGTEAGTHIVKDVNPGPMGSLDVGDDVFGNIAIYQREFTVMNNKLFFLSNNSAASRGLWVSDGTAAGTQMVKNIAPDWWSDSGWGNNGNYGGDGNTNIVTFNNKLYFPASDSVHGIELWVSDGTEAGTQMVKDINPGERGSVISGICAFHNKLYFGTCVDSSLHQLYVSDGTAAGTTPVYTVNFFNPYSSWTPRSICEYHNKLYFVGRDETYNCALWQSDGTNAGTAIVPAPSQNANGFGVYAWSLVVSNNVLYIPCNCDSTIGFELYDLQPPAAVPTVTKNIDATLYPNPATNTVQLQINLQQALATTISLTDITGRTLQQ